jgi:hypothetical protein
MNSLVSSIYNYENDTFGYPQTYKGLDIYPIKLKDIKYQSLFYKLFTYPKLYIPDKQIIKMSYLKFLLFVIQYNKDKDSTEMQDGLIDYLKYATKKDNISIAWRENINLKGLDSISLKLIIDNIEISENDFDNIREIILEQNSSSIEYVESFNPEFEQFLKYNNEKSEGITLQDEIFTFCSIMHINIKEIQDYSVYQFKLHFEKLLTLKEYDIYKPLLVSGQITLKNGEIQHYLYHSKKSGRYDSVLIPKEKFLESAIYKESK